MKKWIRVGLIVLPAALCAVAFAVCSRPPAPREIPAGTETERLAFLASCGMEGELVSTVRITVPQADGIFADYAAMQRIQQLPLTAHIGEPAAVYTYTLHGSSLRAELLCAGDVLIGAQLYLPEEAGIMPILS